MANTVNIRYFILGLLTRQSMSGYDIKRFLKSLGWLIDSPSFGSLYPALHALLEGGLATVEVVPRPDKPPRKIYTITPDGRDVLKGWVAQPVESNLSLKAFVMRLMLANNLTVEGLMEHLERRNDQVAESQEALRRTEESGEELDLGERMVLDYGLAMADAERAWLSRSLEWLAQEGQLEGIAQGEVGP